MSVILSKIYYEGKVIETNVVKINDKTEKDRQDALLCIRDGVRVILNDFEDDVKKLMSQKEYKIGDNIDVVEVRKNGELVVQHILCDSIKLKDVVLEGRIRLTQNNKVLFEGNGTSLADALGQKINELKENNVLECETKDEVTTIVID